MLLFYFVLSSPFSQLIRGQGLALNARSKIHFELELGVQAGSNMGKGAVHLGAQEGQNNYHNDSDEYEDQGVFNKALAFLLQLFDLSAHCYLQ